MERDDVERVVITLHGIRTFGHWQTRLADLLKKSRPDIVALNYRYGYFSSIAFLIPFSRWVVTRRFRAELQLVRKNYPNARIDIVAHSFGTHIAAWAIAGCRNRQELRVHTMILAGSVLKSDFPWGDLLEDGAISRVVNECGTKDAILVINQVFVLFTGMAGRIGFSGMQSSQFANNFYALGHSGYFMQGGRASDEFMQSRWVSYLTSDTIPPLVDERRATALGGALTFVLQNSEPVKLAVYASPLIAVILILGQLYLQAESRRLETLALTLTSEAERLLLTDHERIGDSVLMALEGLTLARKPTLSEIVNGFVQPNVFRDSRLETPLDVDGTATSVLLKTLDAAAPTSIAQLRLDEDIMDWSVTLNSQVVLATAKNVHVIDLRTGSIVDTVAIELADGRHDQLRVAPGGRWVMIPTGDSAITVLSTGKVRQKHIVRFTGRIEKGSEMLAFSADGERFAVALEVPTGENLADTSQVAVCATASARCTSTIVRPSGEVDSTPSTMGLQLTLDGSAFQVWHLLGLAQGAANVVRTVWGFDAVERVDEFGGTYGGGEGFSEVLLTKKGRWVANDAFSEIVVGEFAQGDEHVILQPNADIDVSDDGEYVAAATSVGPMVWRLGDLSRVPNIDGDFDTQRVAFSPHSRFLAAATKNGAAVLFELPQGREVFRTTRSDVMALTFTKDEKQLIGIGKRSMTVWPTQPDHVSATLALRRSILAMGVESGGDLVVVASADGRVIGWRHRENAVAFDVEVPGDATAVQFSNDGRFVAVSTTTDSMFGGTNDPDLATILSRAGKEVETVQLHLGNVAFSGDSSRVLIKQMDSVDLMSLTKPNSSVRVVGRPVGVWDGEHVEVDAAGLDEAELWMFGDGLFSAKKMGAGSWQRTVRLHPADEPHTVEFSPLGRYALVDADKFVSILSTADGHTLGQLSVRDRLQVATYSFDANEKSFARVLEGELTVFDLLRGMEYEHLRSKASAASMSRNGRLVAHGDGQRVMVRRVSDGVVLSTITVSRPVRQILFGHDDQFLVVATDSTVSAHVWQLDHIRRIACERAGPGLSADVWQKFFAGQRYRFTCTH